MIFRAKLAQKITLLRGSGRQVSKAARPKNLYVVRPPGIPGIPGILSILITHNIHSIKIVHTGENKIKIKIRKHVARKNEVLLLLPYKKIEDFFPRTDKNTIVISEKRTRGFYEWSLVNSTGTRVINERKIIIEFLKIKIKEIKCQVYNIFTLIFHLKGFSPMLNSPSIATTKMDERRKLKRIISKNFYSFVFITSFSLDHYSSNDYNFELSFVIQSIKINKNKETENINIIKFKAGTMKGYFTSHLSALAHKKVTHLIKTTMRNGNKKENYIKAKSASQSSLPLHGGSMRVRVVRCDLLMVSLHSLRDYDWDVWIFSSFSLTGECIEDTSNVSNLLLTAKYNKNLLFFWGLWGYKHDYG